jgi:hypothetical protein
MNRQTIALFALLVVAVGCGKKAPEFAEVQGVVRIGGQPHAGLIIHFLPDPGKGNNLTINATGKTDAAGKYSLQHAYNGQEAPGATIGWNRVLIQDASRGPTPQGQAAPPPLVSTIYSNPATTPLSKEVKPGSQSIDLDLTK